jgi:hypothetical protein
MKLIKPEKLYKANWILFLQNADQLSGYLIIRIT